MAVELGGAKVAATASPVRKSVGYHHQLRGADTVAGLGQGPE